MRKFQPEEIDLILVATVTPDHPFPSVCLYDYKSVWVQKMQLQWMLGAACAGFMYGMITAKQFIETDSYKHVLVVGVRKTFKNYRLDRS